MPRLIAVDIGSHAVKVASYRINGREVLLDERYHQLVPQGGAAPMFEQRLAALDALLDDVPALKPDSGDLVLLAFPSSLATFRSLNLPFTDTAQIENTLAFEVESEVPFDLDEMILGWRIAEQGLGSDIVTVLAKRDDVREWIDAMQERGLDPASVHVDADLYGPWGRLRHAAPIDVDAESPSSPLVAVLDLGHLHTTISVIKGGVVRTCRSIGIGGWVFTQAIAQALGCSWEEAETLKHGGPVPVSTANVVPDIPGPAASVSDDSPHDEDTDWEDSVTEMHPSPEGIEAEATVTDMPTVPDPTDDLGPPIKTDESGLSFGLGASSLPPPARSGVANLPKAAREQLNHRFQQLLGELRSTLIQVEDQLGGGIEEIRLTGGSARIAELRELLAEDLGVEVRLAEDPTGENAFGPFSLSAALASTSIPGANKAIDLRVGDLKFRGGTNLVRAALTYGLAGAFFFSVAATVMFAWEYISLSNDLGTAEDAVRVIVVEAAGPEGASLGDIGMDDARAYMAGVTEDASQLATVVGDGKGVPPTIDTLYQLTQSFPPHPDVTVEVTDLTINRTTVQFTAETTNFAASASIEEALRATTKFANATKGQENKQGSKNRFPITIPLGAAEAPEDEG
ncbi:MAG: type II secretion system protein GspL [Myxococcota bacterium]